MLKKNQGFRKLVWGRLLSFLLVLAVVISPFSASFAGTAYADVETELALVSTIASDDNSQVVLQFNRAVSQEDGWSDKIELKGTYDGYFFDDFCYATVNENTVTLNLHSDLVGDKNQIRIKNGAFGGQTSDIISTVFAAHDLSTPSYISTAISSDRKDVTVTFNGNVQSVTEFVYETIDYKIGRGSYTPLTALNEVELTGNTLTIHFPEGIDGKTTIRIAEESLQFVGGNLKTNPRDLCIRLNANPIEFERNALYDGDVITNSELKLYLSQDAFSTGNTDALKAAVTISRDNGGYNTYTALAPNDTVTIENNGRCTYLLVHFFDSLTPGKYQVKIAANTLKNISGLLVDSDIVSGDINVGDHDGPVYQGFSVNADRNVVTLAFNENVYEHNVGITSTGNLANYIQLSRNGSNYNWFDGTVAIVDKTVVITLNTPLVGSQNKIKIPASVLWDNAGNHLNNDIITNFIDVTTTTPPQYMYSVIDNLNHDWTFNFDKNVKRNSLYTGNLLSDSILYLNGVVTSIPLSTTVTFTDNKVVLHFDNPFVDQYIKIDFPENAITNENNNVLTDEIPLDELTPNGFSQPQYSGHFLRTSHTLEMNFSQSITTNTTISQLKAALTYSTDGGNTFSALGANDGVSILEGSLFIYFDKVIQGNLVIKIAANNLKDTFGNVITTVVETETIDTTSAYVTPNLVGSLFSDVPTVLTFDDNAAWRSKIQKVVIEEVVNNCYYVSRALLPSEYTVSAGKLTIHQGVFDERVEYNVYVYSDGYDDRSTNDTMLAIKSKDAYFITPVALDKTSGITATVKIASNRSHGPLNVIFQLMNGQTASSIVAAESEFFGEKGTFKANFNVADFATNPNYTVRAFIVSEYSNSPLSVGANLATQISDLEFDYVSNPINLP
ncbi:hemoblobin-interacting domain-containing protein [Paenibacillus qinlingensis]|uniref:hemoblobin-interacting domain-containing protein n=1 Tax=Paenibacillus qinlingensis TaxID=1837343 RepID=UPI001563F16D|nr:hemoblobin-interacting domain-containing protein [Paenibacillus qinlingensis]NQX61690.1 DUF1533 domain-containing protein [Paenibacillus qinlingensis]